METEKIVEKLDDFLSGSNTFCGACFHGMYTMRTGVLLDAFKEYLETNKNYLDEYTTLFNLRGELRRNTENDLGCICIGNYPPEKLHQRRVLLENKGFWDIHAIYQDDEINEMRLALNSIEIAIENNKKRLEGSDYRNTPEYKKWRKSVFERDDHTCQVCGQRGGKLQAHHVYPFKKYPKKRYDINNGKTLCVACHRKEHQGVQVAPKN